MKRRYDELIRKGITNVTEEEVKQNQRMRDLEDMNREDNPLKQADDAIKLDNTELTMDEQFKIAEGWALKIIEL